MATVTGLTAARMLQIEGESIVAARLSVNNLILTTHAGVDINVGSVRGIDGAAGVSGSGGLGLDTDSVPYFDPAAVIAGVGPAGAPGVGGLGAVTLSGTPTSGQTPTATGSSSATWQTPAAGSGVTDATLATMVQVNTTRTTLDGLYGGNVPKSTVLTKGDILVASGASVVTRLPAGPDGRILTTDSSQATGYVFSVPTSGSLLTSDNIWVDDQAGATDDAKFLAAFNIARLETFPSVIRFSNRKYILSTGGLLPFTGMSIWGSEGYNNPEVGGGNGCGSLINLTMTGGWFVNSSASSTFSVSFGNLAFLGSGANASVMTQTGGATMYCMYCHNLSSSGLLSVFGTQSSKLLITAAAFDGGAWEINNCYEGAFHLGGSDNALWTDGCLLDSNAAYVGSGQYHLWCDGLDKTFIGPMYITCQGDWGGIKVSGTAYNTGGVNAGYVIITGAKIEGRNPTTPCYGANIRVEGGSLMLRDCWVAYGMSNPSLMPGHTDAGVIHQTAGRLIVSGGTTDHTAGQAETVPFVYCAGGSARVKDLSVSSRGGVWTGLPRVKAIGGTVVVDDTATVI